MAVPVRLMLGSDIGTKHTDDGRPVIATTEFKAVPERYLRQ